MAKKMTSKRQEHFLKNIPIHKLKKGARVKAVSSSTRLKDKELIFLALWQCLIEQDIESFKDVLRGHLEAVNKEELSKKAKTSRRTLHRILSPQGNPTLRSISKVISAMYG